jgi:hypothetical protein
MTVFCPDVCWHLARGYRATRRVDARLLAFSFFVPRQAQRSQALHILDDSRTASSFLLQCIIDFRFAPLIAFKYTFGNFSVLRVGHEILSVWQGV